MPKNPQTKPKSPGERFSDTDMARLFQDIPVATFAIDTDHNIIIWNRRCEEITGKKKEDMIGKPLDSQIFYPDSPQRPVMADLLLEKDYKGLNAYYTGKDLRMRSEDGHSYQAQDRVNVAGEIRDILFSARLITIDGEIRGAIETLLDLTELTQAREELQHEATRYRNIYENLQDVYIEISMEGEILEISPSVEGLIQRPRTKIIGKDISHYLDAKSWSTLTRTLKTEGACKNLILTFLGLPKAYGSITAALMGDLGADDKDNRQIIGTIRDVTQEHIAQEAKHTYEAFLRNIIDNMQEMLVSCDEWGFINLCNKTFEDVTGYRSRQLIGRNIFEEQWTEELEPFFSVMNTTLRTERGQLYEYNISKKDGEIVPARFTSSIIRRGKDIKGAVIIIRKKQSRKGGRLKQGTSLITYDQDMDIKETIEPYIDSMNIICICRHKKETEDLPDKTTHIRMSTKDIADKDVGPEDLLNEVRRYANRQSPAIIVVRRLDYISSMFGFNNLLSFLYRLSDFTEHSGSITIVQAIREGFNMNQRSILHEEFRTLETQHEEGEEVLHDLPLKIMKHVDEQAGNQIISFKMIAGHFNISRVTVRKAVRELRIRQLVQLEKAGRSKNIVLTERGKDILRRMSQTS